MIMESNGKQLNKTNENRRIKKDIFETYGVTWISKTSDQNCGNCPFCGLENKFYCNPTEHTWDCKVCFESGNAITFIRKVYSYSQENNKGKHELEKLAKLRGLDVELLEDIGIVKSFCSNEWLYPTLNEQQKVASLHRVIVLRDPNNRNKKKIRILSSPETKPNLLVVHNPKSYKKVFIAEGHWDGLALKQILSKCTVQGKEAKDLKTSVLKDAAIICLPGANTRCLDQLIKFVDGKKVFTLLDWDRVNRNGYRAGEKATIKLHQSLKDYCNLKYLDWLQIPDIDTKNENQAYDIRDLLLMFGENVSWNYMRESFNEFDESILEEDNPAETEYNITKCESFATILKTLERRVIITPRIEATLASILSIIAATSWDGDQLWLRVIGPPSSGKTTLLEMMSGARKYIYPRSELTGFNSGFGGKKSASLIPKLDGKTLIVEDADTIYSSPNVDKVLGEMRGFFNGHSRAEYRNLKVDINEDLRITVIFGGTDVLRLDRRSQLGERFIDIDILGEEYDTSDMLNKAADRGSMINVTKSKETEDDDKCDISEIRTDVELTKEIQSLCTGFIHYLRESKIDAVQFTPEQKTWFINASQYIAKMRARLTEDKNDVIIRPETGTRLVLQLMRMAKSLSIIYGIDPKDQCPREVANILRLVVEDTSCSKRLPIMKAVSRFKSGLTAEEIQQKTKLPLVDVRKYLHEMETFHIVGRLKIKRGVAAQRNSHIWCLTEDMQKIVDRTNNVSAFPEMGGSTLSGKGANSEFVTGITKKIEDIQIPRNTRRIRKRRISKISTNGTY